MKGTNVSQSVIVLSDSETLDRADMLVAKAEEQGATITQTFAFEPGAGAANEDIAEIEAVVAALGQAIATRSPIWLPLPLDLSREGHWRRLSLALQRHGLNLLMGQHMSPSPVEGGYSAIDTALRDEVRAVDVLDQAALASVGLNTLGDEIEAALASAAPGGASCRGELIYSAKEAAELLGQSPRWISYGLREGIFTYRDGHPIEPLRIGRDGRRRFTGSMVRGMARSSHRLGVRNRRQLDQVLSELSRTAR